MDSLVIDPVTDKVVGRYSVGRCKGNHGMALDPEHHRAFLACEENNLIAHEMSSFTARPWTSGRVTSRPPKRYVSFV